VKPLQALGMALVVLLVAAIVIFFAFAEAYQVPGNSMSPSLKRGDRILVAKFVGPIKPDRGDIVAYNVSAIRCGSPGAAVFVHRFVRRRSGRFVMRGDNRRQSCDSRVLGAMPRDALIGQVVAVYWPPSRWGFR